MSRNEEISRESMALADLAIELRDHHRSQGIAASVANHGCGPAKLSRKRGRRKRGRFLVSLTDPEGK